MIFSNLSTILGKKKLRISDVVANTKISRPTLTALFYDSGKGINFSTLNELCRYLNVQPGDLFRFYDLDIDIDQACQYFRNREQYYLDKDGVPLKKGVKELLDYLVSKKIAICLATSSVEKRAITILDNYQLTKYFDAFVFGDEVKRGKPFPDVFLKACKKINVQKNEAIVIEDSEAGIEAGYNAKIRVICIPDMKYPDDKYQLMTCNIYRDLTNIIKYIETVG